MNIGYAQDYVVGDIFDLCTFELPKNEIKSALDKAQNIIKNPEINYKVIDLRIANQIILSDE